MKVSVIIPCYNQFQYIVDAVKSIKQQTYPQENIDIIIVDDCSTEYPLGWDMFDFIANYNIIMYQHTLNKGLAATRNTGIKRAETELILPLDADDRIHSTCIEKMVKEYSKGTHDIVTSYLETFGQYVRISKPHPSPTWNDLRMANRLNCCSLFSKAMWETLNGYDELMRNGYEDWEFWLRATKYGYKIHTIPEVLFYYRKHPIGESMLDKAKMTRQETILYMRKKGSI